MILLVLFAGALMVFAVSRTTNTILLLLGKIWTGMSFLAGALTLVVLRPMVDFALRSRDGHLEGMIDEEFCLWAVKKFDWFLIGSLVVTCLVLWGLLWVLQQNNQADFVRRHFLFVSYGAMVLLVAASVCYGIGTVNKLFDLANWISGIALAECGVLHLPVFLWLRQLNRQKKPV